MAVKTIPLDTQPDWFIEAVASLAGSRVNVVIVEDEIGGREVRFSYPPGMPRGMFRACLGVIRVLADGTCSKIARGTSRAV